MLRLLGTPLLLATLLLILQSAHGQRPLGNATFGASHNSTGVINALQTSTTGHPPTTPEEPIYSEEEDDHQLYNNNHYNQPPGFYGSVPGHSSIASNQYAIAGGVHPGLTDPHNGHLSPSINEIITSENDHLRLANSASLNPAPDMVGRSRSINPFMATPNPAQTGVDALGGAGPPGSFADLGGNRQPFNPRRRPASSSAIRKLNKLNKNAASPNAAATAGADSGIERANDGNIPRRLLGHGTVGMPMHTPGHQGPGSRRRPYDNVQGEDPLWQIRQRFQNERYLNPIIYDNDDMDRQLGVGCNFETECAWTWKHDDPQSFQVVTGANLTESNRTGMMPGPKADVLGDANGHFLHLRLTNNSTAKILTSPMFGATRENCYLEVYTHQSMMAYGSLRIVIETVGSHESSWVPAEVMGNDLGKWLLNKFRIDKITKDFRILFEVVPNRLGDHPRGHVSIDNLRMVNCFPDAISTNNCSFSQVRCTASKVPVCIKTPKICDIEKDCDDEEDETLNCDKIPFGGRCDFESGWCGWQNYGNAILSWARHSGPTPTEKTGPDMDHTHEASMENVTGYYMFVNMNQHANDSEKKTLVGLASNAIMNSVIFNPPPLVHTNASSPYRNSCVVRFYVHQFGMNPGSINLSSVEIKEKENVTTTLWWSSKNLGEYWVRVDIILPNITTKYYLQFEARMGMRIFSDVAIDDFSLSPECFGLNIPAEDLQGYNYWDPRIGGVKQPHKDFSGKSYLELNTCGAKGQHGPTPADCLTSYNNTEAFNAVQVIDRQPFKGIQSWKVPNEGYYTIIAKGAGGGLGSGGVGSSRGAMVLSVLELHKDEEIYILVGQSGEHACIKSMGYRDETCEPKNKPPFAKDTIPLYTSKTQQVKNTVIEDGAGGGGGGTYVFLLNSANTAVPLLVAGGGGGLGVGRYLDEDVQHGKKSIAGKKDVSGTAHSDHARHAGPGGGWRAQADMGLDPKYGASLLEGGRGGLPCYPPRGTHGQGGFGGGGGGCDSGGGGGGFSGGDTMINSTNGQGGSSFLSPKRSVQELSIEHSGANSGHGAVLIIPAIQGCGCDYRCVALDEYRSMVGCICPDGWTLKPDNFTACELQSETPEMQYLIVFFVVVVVILVAALASLILILYNRFQRKRQAALRHKMLLEQDLQLSRLRSTADDTGLTNFNPNYGCDGILNGNVDVKSLPQVARESLRLVKALGQGAFGEVYQGLYRHRDGDAVEMPVAVKTLPEMSTGQAESDFLMEAAIMAKFNHPNIVHLIGVCFDRHPRFIVLELLAGGDLKNFLREGRNKPERPSPLTMKDLIFCALDVAKGCRYMESKRFIHRDIAARNCLLSSKGPGRVVKIADFGMARDIYRSDYYRKGGKAMLPIKWMPPEAFLDGIFTSKTDVWSFGVLLWEVFSLGLMPYTGLPNRDVMQLVTGGGRLDAPPGCPNAIYRIMADCWNPTPEERPTFSNLLERLTTCTQDPEVMNAPLPSFFRPPSNERDTTIMRPPGNDDFCLQVPNSSDYLIPLPGPRTVAERLLSEATGVTIPDTLVTCTPPKTTSPRIINGQPQQLQQDGKCWETSFIREQPTVVSSMASMPAVQDPTMLVDENGPIEVLGCPVVDKLISLDTPQQTPTSIQPPISFSTPMTNGPVVVPSSHGHNGVVVMAHCNGGLNGSPQLVNGINGGANGSGIVPPPPIVDQIDTAKLLNSIPQPPITLDPSTLNKQQAGVGGTSYANIRMINASSLNGGDHGEKMAGGRGNGGGGGGNGGGSNHHHSNSSGSEKSGENRPTAFTIQTFSDRYINNENHSEISC